VLRCSLQAKLLRQDLFEEFCDEFTREMNQFRMEHRASLSAAEGELERVQNDIHRVIEAIKNGFAGPDMKAEWDALQERKTALGGSGRTRATCSWITSACLVASNANTSTTTATTAPSAAPRPAR
jgi:hypothetical protein